MKLEVWLYGPMADYAGQKKTAGYAQLEVELPEGATMRQLMEQVGVPLDKKGITFVNAQLTDMPGLAADLEREMHDGDRVGLFHERSMWPFQYRFGASTSSELSKTMQERGFLHHGSWKEGKDPE